MKHFNAGADLGGGALGAEAPPPFLF